MNQAVLTAPPTWYWIVVGLSIVWNLMGCWACYSQFSIGPEKFAKLPEGQRDAWSAMPGFAKGAYIVAVAAGLLGAILLAVRLGIAQWAFVISLIGIVIQFGWFFGPYRGGQKLGWSAAIFPFVIALLCVGEICFACYAFALGWIH